jgi:hypothetical protein
VSEGDPGNWAAVAGAISDGVREHGWRQRELAERSHVSAAVVREIQLHTVERRRSPRTLGALSLVFGWAPEHLDAVRRGCAQQTPGSQAAPDRAIWSRPDSMERQLDELAGLLTQNRSGTATVIHHVRGDPRRSLHQVREAISGNRLGSRPTWWPLIRARLAEQPARRREAAGLVRIRPCR